MNYGEWVAAQRRAYQLVKDARKLAERITNASLRRPDDRMSQLAQRANNRYDRRMLAYQNSLDAHGLKLREKYGDVELSIVAGYNMQCKPQDKSGRYTLVDVAILKDSRFLSLEDLGISDDLIRSYSCGDTFGYVPWLIVERIRDHLRKRAEGEV